MEELQLKIEELNKRIEYLEKQENKRIKKRNAQIRKVFCSSSAATSKKALSSMHMEAGCGHG